MGLNHTIPVRMLPSHLGSRFPHLDVVPRPTVRANDHSPEALATVSQTLAARPEQVKTFGEVLRHHVQFAGQVALPFDHPMRRVDTVERQDRAEHRVRGAGEQVMDREVVSPAGQRIRAPSL